MMSPNRALLAVLLVGLPLVSACSSGSGRFAGPAQPASLPPQPTPPVTSAQLPPPVSGGPTVMTDNGLDSSVPDGQPRIVAAPAPTQAPTRESVLGQWSLAGQGEQCQINVALTSWEGGYRASTRGCSSPEFSSVGAWNIEGNLVVLKDSDGNAVARLGRSGASRFEGRTELGGSISMSR